VRVYINIPDIITLFEERLRPKVVAENLI